MRNYFSSKAFVMYFTQHVALDVPYVIMFIVSHRKMMCFNLPIHYSDWCLSVWLRLQCFCVRLKKMEKDSYMLRKLLILVIAWRITAELNMASYISVRCRWGSEWAKHFSFYVFYSMSASMDVINALNQAKPRINLIKLIYKFKQEHLRSD